VKPSFGDASLRIAVILGALVAVVLVRQGLATRVEGAPTGEAT
jgi:hypothetical protein